MNPSYPWKSLEEKNQSSRLLQRQGIQTLRDIKIIAVLKLNGNSVLISIVFFLQEITLLRNCIFMYNYPFKGQINKKRSFLVKIVPNYFNSIYLLAKCLYSLISIILKIWKIRKAFEKNNKIAFLYQKGRFTVPKFVLIT